MNGLIHLYHGDGKGKTSAAIGLCVRAAGNDKKVVFVQFLKGRTSGEISILDSISNITVIRNSKDFGFISCMADSEMNEITNMHNENLRTALSIVTSGDCDVLVLDEICAAYHSEVIDKSLVENLIINKPASLELVLTGRNPAALFLDKADYITEMHKEKHPFDNHIPARKGIEF